MNEEPLVQVEQISKSYPVYEGMLRKSRGTVRALQNINFTIDEGEIVGVIGESGSGKSTLGRILTCLTPPTTGKVFIDEVEVTALSQKELVSLRKTFQIVFQNPAESLNPRKSILDTLNEVLLFHGIVTDVSQLLHKVGLDSALLHRYPHELSVGQLARVALARALCTEPKFLVLDECVSSLDISVQAQVLNFLMDLRARSKTSYLFISHDLAVVRHIADRVLVMYQGEIVETGPAEKIFENPSHSYTKLLLSAALP